MADKRLPPGLKKLVEDLDAYFEYANEQRDEEGDQPQKFKEAISQYENAISAVENSLIDVVAWLSTLGVDLE